MSSPDALFRGSRVDAVGAVVVGVGAVVVVAAGLVGGTDVGGGGLVGGWAAGWSPGVTCPGRVSGSSEAPGGPARDDGGSEAGTVVEAPGGGAVADGG